MGTCKWLKFPLLSNPRTEVAAMEGHGEALVRRQGGSEAHPPAATNILEC